MYSKIHTIQTEEEEEEEKDNDDDEEEEEDDEDKKLMLLHVSKAKTTPDVKSGLIHTSTWEKYSHKCW